MRAIRRRRILAARRKGPSGPPPISPGVVTFPYGDFEAALVAANGWGYSEFADALRFTRVTRPYPVRQGLYSVRAQVRAGDDANGERAEVCLPRVSNVIQYVTEATGTQYVAFSVYLPVGWQAPAGTDPWGIVTQLHGPDAYAVSPCWSLHAESSYYVAMTAGNVDSPAWPSWALSDNSLQLGKWVDWVVKLVYHKTAGSFTIWRRNQGATDFTQVREVTGIPTLQYKNSEGGAVENHYWKHGFYRKPQATITNTLYVDGFTTGTGYQSVVDAAFGSLSTGVVAGSRLFSGGTQRIDWPNNWNPAGSLMTVSAWVKFVTLGNAYIFAINNGTPNLALALSNVHSSGQLQFQRPGSVTLYRYTAQGLMTTGVWYHILATHDGAIGTNTSIHIYLNGVECSYTGGGGANGSGEQALTGLWSVGGRTWDNTRNIAGNVAQVAVWDRVLAAEEITALAGGASAIGYPSGIKFYWPGNVTSLADLANESDGVLTGATVSADGPTITYPTQAYP